MTSNAGHRDYDENLLASAPVATKAQLQSGYNPELLAEKATPPPSRRDVERRGSNTSSTPVEQADHEPMPAKIPFYRTRKWIIIIAVVTLVVIAVAVGVGVGVSKTKHSSATVQSAGSASATDSPPTSGVPLPGNPQTTVTGAPDTSTNTATQAITAGSTRTSLPPFSTPGGDQGTTSSM